MTHPHLLYHDMIEKSIGKFNKYLDIIFLDTTKNSGLLWPLLL